MAPRFRSPRLTGALLPALILSLVVPATGLRVGGVVAAGLDGVGIGVDIGLGMGGACAVVDPAVGPTCRSAARVMGAPVGESITSLWTRIVEATGAERAGPASFGEDRRGVATPPPGVWAAERAPAPVAPHRRASATGRAPRPPPIAA